MARSIVRSVGAALQNERQRRALKQADVAAAAGIRRTHLSQIENGKVSAGLETLHRLCLAIGIKLSDLLAGIDF